MFCQRAPDRRRHSFMYNKPGGHPFVGGAGFEVNYEYRGLLKTALFMRRNAAPHLGSLSVSDVEKVLTDFISNNFWIIGSEAWDGCLLGAGQSRDTPHRRAHATAHRVAPAQAAPYLQEYPCGSYFPGTTAHRTSWRCRRLSAVHRWARPSAVPKGFLVSKPLKTHVIVSKPKNKPSMLASTTALCGARYGPCGAVQCGRCRHKAPSR